MNRIPRRYLMPLVAAVVTLLVYPLASPASDYDPLAIAGKHDPSWLDLTVDDKARERSLPIRVYLPAAQSAAPVVLFSHGLGGSRQGPAYLPEHWAARGYVCIFIQHPGSDASVWKEQQLGQRMKAMKEAANVKNFLLRVKDVPAVLDQLARWNETQGHALKGRLDMARVGMSGHSFGAMTTQAVSGQNFGPRQISLVDPRIKAAIMFSPSSPLRRGNLEEAFGSVKIPWMLMTGTKDVSPIAGADVPSRLAVFPALPAGGKYELVLEGAEHSAFTDRALPGDHAQRNPNHHRAILALSTAFWDAWLCEDAAARAWLDGNGPRSVLEKDDRWQTK
jgi:predicted dienelactone hydrolase